MNQEHTQAPLAVSVKEASRLLSLSRATLTRLSHNGVFRTVKVGKRTLIPYEELETLLRTGVPPKTRP